MCLNGLTELCWWVPQSNSPSHRRVSRSWKFQWQETGTNGWQDCAPSGGSIGEFLLNMFEILLAVGIPWLATASLPSPPLDHFFPPVLHISNLSLPYMNLTWGYMWCHWWPIQIIQDIISCYPSAFTLITSTKSLNCYNVDSVFARVSPCAWTNLKPKTCL